MRACVCVYVSQCVSHCVYDGGGGERGVTTSPGSPIPGQCPHVCTWRCSVVTLWQPRRWNRVTYCVHSAVSLAWSLINSYIAQACKAQSVWTDLPYHRAPSSVEGSSLCECVCVCVCVCVHPFAYVNLRSSFGGTE